MCIRDRRYTPRTITDPALLEAEIARITQQGYACDDEEFLPGLFCVAMLVPAADGGRSNTGIAIQAPVMRLSHDRLGELLPPLRRAVAGIAGRGTGGRRSRVRRRRRGSHSRPSGRPGCGPPSRRVPTRGHR